MPLFQLPSTISSRLLFSNSVPLIWLLRLSTYARWCLPQWKFIVFSDMWGSRALRGYGGALSSTADAATAWATQHIAEGSFWLRMRKYAYAKDRI